MRSKIIVTALSGAVSALLEPYDQPVAAMLVPRSPAMTAHPLQHARDLDSCSSVADDIVGTLTEDSPTPGPAIQSLALASPDLFIQPDPCVDPVLPTTDAELASEWKSFQTAYTSWQSKHLCDFKNLLDECMTVGEVSEVFDSDLLCTTLLDKAASEDCPTTGAKSTSKPPFSPRPTATTSTSSGSGETTATQAGGEGAAGVRTVAFGAVLAGIFAFVVGV